MDDFESFFSPESMPLILVDFLLFFTSNLGMTRSFIECFLSLNVGRLLYEWINILVGLFFLIMLS